jgi:hypothetical protein
VPIIESSAGQGSGLLVSDNGLVVTNRHVVDGARTFTLSLYNGTKAKAVVLHRHSHLDLALMKAAFATKTFFHLPSRISREYDAGDEVVAIGHPRGLTFTSTRGIVSEPKRTLEDGIFVQSDVAINPGNSGGPLLDINGKLIGLNTQIYKDSEGLGFSIPASSVAEYFAEIGELILEKKITVPSDKDLTELDNTLSPHEIAEAAIRGTGFRCEREDDSASGRWQIMTPDGESFSISISEDSFFVLTHIATLDDNQMDDPAIFRQCLKWHSNIPPIQFYLNDDNDLFLIAVRPIEDLDISEATYILHQMAKAVDAYCDLVRDYLE